MVTFWALRLSLNQAMEMLFHWTMVILDIRLIQIFSDKFGGITILPYVWWLYHPSGSAPLQPLEAADAYNQFVFPLEEGADGLIHYMFGASGARRNYYHETVIPLVSDFLGNDCGFEYTINPSWTDGGEIDPGKPQSFPFSAESNYDILTLPGYFIKDVQLNGESLGEERSHVFQQLCGEYNLNAIFTNVDPHEAKLAGSYDKATTTVLRDSTGGILTIPYESDGSPIEIRIYSRGGQEINVIDLGIRPAGPGYYEYDGLNQDGEKIASGLYFYQLLVGGQSTVVKFVVIR